MNIIISLLFLIHGMLHIIGYWVAFGKIKPVIFKKKITPTFGYLWLSAGLAFIFVATVHYFQNETWPGLAIFCILYSQFLIIIFWKDARFGTVLNVILLCISIVGFSSFRFYNLYKNDAIAEWRKPMIVSHTITNEDIQNLPKPVQKYMRYTGCIGKPAVNKVAINLHARMRRNSRSPWMEMMCEQQDYIFNSARLFFLRANMNGMPVAGYHRYQYGKATMDIRLFSLFKEQYFDGPKMDTSETVTFFNDMCCFAPASLTDKRINWHYTNGNEVYAGFTNYGITVNAYLQFNDTGELVNFISYDRYEINEGKKRPWATLLREYQNFNGFRLASFAEAYYQYGSKFEPYGIFQILNVEYNRKVSYSQNGNSSDD